MLRSVTLQNFKSFGARQTVPLEPLTVLVGPNNSGKSNFLTVGRWIRNSLEHAAKALDDEGGLPFLVHRPAVGTGGVVIGWETDAGSYATELEPRPSHRDLLPVREELKQKDYGVGFDLGWRRMPDGRIETRHDQDTLAGRQLPSPPQIAFVGWPFYRPYLPSAFAAVFAPLAESRTIKLSIEALRRDAPVVPEPKLTSDGEGLAAVLGLWRGSDPPRAEALDDFLKSCLPEFKHALVKPAPTPSAQRLWIQQTDGELIDAAHLSDGVLFFTALAMHAIDATPGSLIFVEEPEHSVHPRRIRDLVDLMRRAVHERGCQFVIATHSPALLDEFRDEPEAIVLFGRNAAGTHVRRLSDVPELVDKLREHVAEPGEMLVNGFLSEPLE